MKQIKMECANCSVNRKCIYKSLSETSRELLNKEKEIRIAPREKVLFVEGAPIKEIMMIHRGLAVVIKETSNKKECVVEYLAHGKSMEIPPAKNMKYGNTAMAMREVQLCAIPVELYLQLIRQENLVDYVLNEAYQRTQRYRRFMHVHKSFRAKEKVIALLKDLNSIDEIENAVELKQENIAQLTCLTRETVARIVSGLKRSGVLKIVEGKMFIDESGVK